MDPHRTETLDALTALSNTSPFARAASWLRQLFRR
jgi:hypothetical protein